MEGYRDYVLRAMVEDTLVTAYVASSMHLVEEARKLHGTSPVATAALGRALTLVGIMGVVLAENQRVSLQICCRGPLGGIFVQGNWKGEVRGYVSQPLVIVPPREDGKLNVEAAVGKGSQLIVVRDLGFGEPWVGSVEMPRGGIAYDLAYYFTLSEQLPTACSAGVYVGTQGEVLSAGGFIVHTPSGTDEGVVEQLEQNISQLQPVSLEFFAGKNPIDLLAELLRGLRYRVVGENALFYRCSCSRERARHMLSLLGRKEIKQLLQEEGRSEVRCVFCNRVYLFTKEELEALLTEIG
ncbi:MAG: Hsp33 family molecular chaperone HslO [Candidatus Atribacteria bacterium]|nr:Hsp33 family molecular chaperone HslO [Candidatus Atribacteria bacterium]